MICLENGKTRVKFDETEGKITELRYETRNFLGNAEDIFLVALRDESGRQTVLSTSMFHLKTAKQKDGGFFCIYENDMLEVNVEVRAKDNLQWVLSIVNHTAQVIEWVDYPRILVPDDLHGREQDSQILWGFNEGVLVNDITMREQGFKYREPNYPGEGLMGIFPAIVETQLMAYYNEEAGLYLAAHDRDNHVKGIDFYSKDGGILLQFRHFTGSNFGKDYRIPYPMVMKFFHGDWHIAAELYRMWFEEEKKESFISISENPVLPDWYGESPVIVTYPVRGQYDTDEMKPNKLFPYENIMEHVERLEREFDSRIMVLLMHWEGTAPWAPPFVWPPYGGEEALRRLIEKLHARGDVLGVYCSGIGWTIQSRLVEEYHMQETFEREHLEKVMCVSPEQTLLPSKICTAQRSGYDMCPSVEYTKKVMCGQVEQMVKVGIDYIQLLDQNHGGTSYFCYSREHGHPPVPGRWQVEAMKELLKAVEKHSGKVLFGCESAAAESYIPYLLFSDNRYNLCYHIGKPVPLYAYLYHRYVNNFSGNQVCTGLWFDHQKSPDNILEHIAYSFCAGDLLTVILNEDGKFLFNWGYRDMSFLPDQEAVGTLIRNLNRWRKGRTADYLHTGEMIPPYPVQSGRNLYIGRDGYDRDIEQIHTSAWRSGSLTCGQFLVNYNKKETECTVMLPNDREFTISEADGTKRTLCGGAQSLWIKELSAVLIEWKTEERRTLE